MSKVPVVETAVDAYRFGFRNYPRIFGIVWAPLLLMQLGVVRLFAPLMQSMQGAVRSHDPSAILGVVGEFLVLELVAFVLLVFISVGITRLALGRTIRWPFLLFSLGSDFWRLLAADFLVALIGFAMAFVLVRLGSLLAPIVLEEKRVSLSRNWTLTRGNAWRILGVFVLILLPLVALGIAQMVAMALLGGPNIFVPAVTPDASMARSVAMMRLFSDYWFIYLPVSLAITPIFYGPLLGVGALIYRRIAPEAPAS